MKPISRDEEEQLWNREIYEVGPDTTFTQNVMQAIENVEIDPPIPAREWRTKSTRGRRILIRFAAGAAAIVLLGAGSYQIWQDAIGNTSPFAAQDHQGMSHALTVNSHWLWYEEYKRAGQFGLYQAQDIKVEDQGYTMEIQAVLMDRSHIVIATKQFDPDGRSLKYRMRSPFLISDTQGNQVATLGRYLRNTDSEIQDYVYVFNGPVPDKIVIRGQPADLEADPEEENAAAAQQVRVNWPVELKLDMTKAKAQSVSEQMDQMMTTPDGLNISTRQFMATPNGIRLDMALSLASPLRESVPPNWSDGLQIVYYVKSGEGNDTKVIGSHHKKVETQQIDPQSGVLEWSNEFDASVIAPDSDKLRVVIDEVIMRFHSDGVVQLNPSELHKNPAVMTDEGDTITFTKSSMISNRSTGEQAVALYATGTFVNEPLLDQWVAVDDHGQEYEVHIGGAYTQASQVAYVTGKDLEFAVRGMTEIPESLTLKRTVIGKKSSVNWAFDLPVVSDVPW